MRLGASITLLWLIALVAPAVAATTPNSCRYSFDTLYRDMPVTLSSSVANVPEVVPGQTVTSEAGTASVELPAYLALFGYNVGLLHAGHNDIPVKVWIAIRGTNTKERVQVAGPIAVTASTTITVDPADDNRFLSATPFVYSTPVIPEQTWTAVGGDVVLAQDAGGNLPQLPLGANGALRTVTGSAVIDASFGGGVSMSMDCRPGRTTGIEFDFAGPTYAPEPATPFATLPGPRNLMCLRSAGAELEPLRAALRAPGAAPEYAVGTPYTLPATTLDTDAVALEASVTIAASNTAEGVQTVRASGTTLPATTWTPTGDGPIQFTLAPPRSVPPYGSLQLTLADATLDCSPAAIRIADPTIPAPGAGRYAFDLNLDRPIFASAVDSAKPPVEDPPDGAPPTPTPAPTASATPTPRPAVKPPAGSIVSTRLTSRGGRIELNLRCPSGSATCRGTIKVETVRKPKRALTRRASYSIAPGKLRTITLALSKAGRTTLKRHRSVKARVTITTSAGVSATRRVTLGQRRGS